MAARSRNYYKSHPLLLCYRQSVTFCNPLNIVQSTYANRAGDRTDYSAEALAEKFNNGYRIDVEVYSGLVPTACHQEIELAFSNTPK
jgi:hypothetical protein